MHHSLTEQRHPIVTEALEPDVYEHVRRYLGEPWSEKQSKTCSEIIRRAYKECFDIELPGRARNIGLYPRQATRHYRGRKGVLINSPLTNETCWVQIDRPEHLAVCVFDTGPHPNRLMHGVQPIIYQGAHPHVALCLFRGSELVMFHKDLHGARFESMVSLYRLGYREPGFYRHKDLPVKLALYRRAVI